MDFRGKLNALEESSDAMLDIHQVAKGNFQRSVTAIWFGNRAWSVVIRSHTCLLNQERRTNPEKMTQVAKGAN